MAKPDAQQILEDATRLKNERFQLRDSMLDQRNRERFNETVVDVPPAYQKTTNQHSSNIIDDEGRQIATLVFALPTPHLTPPSPEDQPLTTKVEQVLTAMHQELEDKNGPVWWQCTSAQTHDNLGVIYAGAKRKPYAKQPRAPRTDDIFELDAYAVKNERYKKDAGICAVFDYRFVPTSTFYYTGNIYDPLCVYEIKQVPERELMKTYGIYKTSNGGFTKKTDDLTTTPSGYPEDHGGSETLINVIEYWDHDWCLIVAETSEKKWLGTRQVKGAYVLAEWEHNWGRTPYFPRPAFVSEQLDEDKKFAGPLDGIHNEMPSHKRLSTMTDAVAYQTAFSPLQVITKEQGETIVDDSGKDVTFLELEPGKARQMAPGQEIRVIPQSPEVAILMQERMASLERLRGYTLSPVAKGVSPGADTANAALSNLHRFQLSTLDPMAKQTSRQGRAMYRFWLERIMEMVEPIYVLDPKTDTYLSLSAEEIPSLNVQCKATPDQGQQQLLIEKHATELWMSQAISKIDMYEMMGYENPEEKARAVEVEQYAQTLKPIVWQQVTALLGMTDAINAMVKANAETGSASSAIAGLMGQAEGLQNGQTGMGQGSQDQPRTPGVRMPTTDVNTQEMMANG